MDMPQEDDHPSSAKYYPMFVSLAGRVCLVIGGGTVAERKIRTLLQFGATIKVVAKELSAGLREEMDMGSLSWIARTYDASQLIGVDLVFAATSDASLNREIAAAARDRRLWCNLATNPELGSFIVPAILDKGPLTIAISTSGSSPALAKRIRERLEKEFGPAWGIFLDLMGALRVSIQLKGLGTSENQRIFREITELPILEWIEAGEHQRILEAIHDLCRQWLSRNELNQLWDTAWKQSSSSSPHCSTSAEPLDT